MKHLSKLMVIVMMLAVTAAFAFRPADSVRSGKTTYYWFKLNSGGNSNHASDYTRVGAKPTCAGGSSVCSVQAPDDGTMHPAGIPASGPVAPNGTIQDVGYKAN